MAYPSAGCLAEHSDRELVSRVERLEDTKDIDHGRAPLDQRSYSGDKETYTKKPIYAGEGAVMYVMRKARVKMAGGS